MVIYILYLYIWVILYIYMGIYSAPCYIYNGYIKIPIYPHWFYQGTGCHAAQSWPFYDVLGRSDVSTKCRPCGDWVNVNKERGEGFSTNFH